MFSTDTLVRRQPAVVQADSLPPHPRDSQSFAAAAAAHEPGQIRPRLYTCTPGVRRIPGLAAMLDDFDLQYRLKWRPLGGKVQNNPQDGVLAWGERPSALRARRYAKRHGLGVYHIEDGFLRSMGLGRDDPPLSIVLDDLSLYLDASQPSRLEALIQQPLDAKQAERAQALIQAWRQGRVSKYNHSRDLSHPLPDGCVLVIDQTRGDASIHRGMASERSFADMLDAALAEYPHSAIVVKVHPDVVAGRKQGYFDLTALRANPRIQVLDADAHPTSLMPCVRQVYTVTSQMGFEALLWGVPVRVFGMPFYAGWGLTQDNIPAPERRRDRGKVTLEQLVYAALIDYPRYLDPETGKRCEVETLLRWLATQRQARQRPDWRQTNTTAADAQRGWRRMVHRLREKA